MYENLDKDAENIHLLPVEITNVALFSDLPASSIWRVAERISAAIPRSRQIAENNPQSLLFPPWPYDAKKNYGLQELLVTIRFTKHLRKKELAWMEMKIKSLLDELVNTLLKRRLYFDNVWFKLCKDWERVYGLHFFGTSRRYRSLPGTTIHVCRAEEFGYVINY